MRRKETIDRARHLRRDMSLPEVLLWRVLRQRPGGFKFRRQHPIGPYVADFFCREAGLAIEVDGEAHNRGERPRRDAERDEAFRIAGVKTLRIAADTLLADLDAVIRLIVAEAEARLPLHHPAAPDGPPPRENAGRIG